MSKRSPARQLSAASRATLGSPRSRERNEQLRDAIAAGCAMVAYADGWVTDEERTRMVSLIRTFEPTGAFGLEELVARFEAVSDLFALDHDSAERSAMAALARLRGVEPYPALLAETCCAIADADGGFDAEEREAAIRICEHLGLDPGEFGLADAP